MARGAGALTGAPILAALDPQRVDELVAMWRASFEQGVGIDPHPLAEQRDYLLREVVPGNDVRLALLEDELVGFVAASAQSIAQLYVRIGFQRRDIGGAMKKPARGGLFAEAEQLR